MQSTTRTSSNYRLLTSGSTLGIDLASQAANTAGCIIRWNTGQATVVELEVGLDDKAIVRMGEGCEKVGIDAPFGWPQSFASFLQAHAAGTLDQVPWTSERRDALRFRRTDLVVQETTGIWPLSVSSDRIGITAMRCAGLLAMLDGYDRSGSGRVVEVYPAVALRQWGLNPRGYKGVRNTVALAKLLTELQGACHKLVLSPEQASLCARSDHAFDALVSALIARAAMLDFTVPIPDDHRSLAAIEGWIHIPEPDSLSRLIGQ